MCDVLSPTVSEVSRLTRWSLPPTGCRVVFVRAEADPAATSDFQSGRHSALLVGAGLAVAGAVMSSPRPGQAALLGSLAAASGVGAGACTDLAAPISVQNTERALLWTM